MGIKRIVANKKSLISFILIFSVLLCFVPESIASAYAKFGGKLSGGAQSIYYYIDSTATTQKDIIDLGFSFWNGHTSKVSISSTTVKSNSKCDCYWGNYYPSDSQVIATTYMYLNNQELTDLTKDWQWCEINFNSLIFNDNIMVYNERYGTACHELGHVFGLAHTNSTPTNVMCQLGSGRTVSNPSTDDVNGLKNIYGN